MKDHAPHQLALLICEPFFLLVVAIAVCPRSGGTNPAGSTPCCLGCSTHGPHEAHQNMQAMAGRRGCARTRLLLLMFGVRSTREAADGVPGAATSF